MFNLQNKLKEKKIGNKNSPDSRVSVRDKLLVKGKLYWDIYDNAEIYEICHNFKKGRTPLLHALL